MELPFLWQCGIPTHIPYYYSLGHKIHLPSVTRILQPRFNLNKKTPNYGEIWADPDLFCYKQLLS